MPTPSASLDEIIGAYQVTNFRGDEDANAFSAAIKPNPKYIAAGATPQDSLRRQARESILVLAQISYLHVHAAKVIPSLNPDDARQIFKALTPIVGPRKSDPDSEILRLASLFTGGNGSISFDYSNSIVDDVVESGFKEGGKVKRTHITIERNAGLRKEFFAVNPTAICDVCTLDTLKTYPWTERVIDLHHLLPLSSGTRVEATGTTFVDLGSGPIKYLAGSMMD